MIIVTWKFLSPAISHTNFEKKLVSTDMTQMTWNGLKREKNTILRYPISGGLSRFFRPGIGRYRYHGVSLTFSDDCVSHRRPLQFGKFVDVPIVYRLQKTILKYLHYLLRYGKSNMVSHSDINPRPKSSDPHFSKTGCQILTKFCRFLGVNSLYNIP